MHFAAAAAADTGGPLTVAEVLALRAKLPKIVRNSPVALLGACRSHAKHKAIPHFLCL